MTNNATGQIAQNELKAFLNQGFIFSLADQGLVIGFGESKSAKFADPQLASIFNPDFYLSRENPWKIFQKSMCIGRDELLATLNQWPSEHKTWNWQDPDKSKYLTQFQLAQKYIQSGQLAKIVPAQFASATVNSLSNEISYLLKNLLENSGEKFVYGYWDSNEALFGASPELLFEVQGSKLTTMALAGTRSTKLEAKSSLLNDKKEMREHQLVIDGLMQKLSKIGKAQVSKTYVWNIGTICHLRTDFTVKLRKLNYSIDELCEVLHPTAALGFSPVTIAKEKMHEFDSEISREFFGAPFCIKLPNKKTRALVAIRNLQWRNGKVYLGTGSGLIQESDFESEWQEHDLKRQSVREMFGV